MTLRRIKAALLMDERLTMEAVEAMMSVIKAAYIELTTGETDA